MTYSERRQKAIREIEQEKQFPDTNNFTFKIKNNELPQGIRLREGMGWWFIEKQRMWGWEDCGAIPKY